MLTVSPGTTQAQTSKSRSQRDIASQSNGAIDLLRSGQTDLGTLRLRAALRAAADSKHFGLTIQAYTTAAQGFAGARDNATATEVFDEALTTRAAQRDNRDVALLWFEYARFLSKTNQNERGITIASEARRRMQQTFGQSSAEDIASGDLLASLLVNNGQVASGLNLSETIYIGARTKLGDKEPLTWRTTNNYAEALRMLGYPDVAGELDEPLLQTRIQHYGLGSIQAVVSSSNVALNHLAMGDEAKTMAALDLQRKAAIALSDPTSEHVAQADTWIAYARAYFHPERPLDSNALETMAKVKDWDGAPDLLRIKTAQLSADQFEHRGATDRALALRIDAYDRSRTSVSPAHPMTFDALLGIALARQRHNAPDTLTTFQSLERQVFAWMLREVGTAGNRFVAETTRRLADDILYAFGRYALTTPAAAPAYADAVSRWKTMENGERTSLRLAIDQMPDATTRALAQTVVRLSGQQQELLSSGRIDDTARAVLGQLQAAQQSLAARTDTSMPPARVATPIEDRLAPKDVLVDFFVSGQRGRRVTGEAMPVMQLQAVIRRKGASPALIDLGPMSLFMSTDATAMDSATEFRRLHETLMSPLKPYLGNAERLYLVPDAELYSLPFSLLQDAGGRFLDEIYDVHILTRADAIYFTGRDPGLTPGGKAVLAGGLDYAGAAEQLPGTKTEIDRVDADLQRAKITVTALSGAQGREPAVRAAARDASLIHLATHGFFKAATDRTDAMWRSGLLFTGSKLSQPPQRDADDGVLYAQELMDWDLSAADLVVLSACQTALGDPSRIGSVRGLPTALAIAGARRSLLTLWEVSDIGVANLMARFYQILADDKLEYAAALRRVRIEAMRGKIDGARDPAVWAAFVLFES